MAVALSPDELRSLTGKVRWSAQARELQALGIPFRKRTDGSLLVIRAAVEGLSAAMVVSGATLPPEPTLDLQGL